MARRVKDRDDLILGIKVGLLTREHYQRMGKAIWLFIGLQSLTRLYGGDGHINSSQEKIMKIAVEEWGLSRATFYRYFGRLVDEGYLVKHEDGSFGISKYENIHTFFERRKKRGNAKTPLKNRLKSETRSLKNETQRLKSETELGSKPSTGDEEDMGVGSVSPPNSDRQRKRDPRLDHPAIKIYRSLAHLWPEHAVRDGMIECYEEVDEERWREAIQRWIAKGYNKRNVEGIMDVARKGFREEAGDEAGWRVSGKPGVSQDQRDYYAAQLDPKD